MIQFMKNDHQMDVGLYLQMIHGQNAHGVSGSDSAPTVHTIDITALGNITLENIRKHPNVVCVPRDLENDNIWLHKYVYDHNYNNVNEINLL